MGMLFTAALFVGYELLPGQVQRVAMLERDGQANQARDLLEKSYANGDRSPRTLLQLQALYEQLGQIDKAKQLLETLLVQSPRDANVLKRASSFYKMTQNESAYIASLRAQIDVKYSEAVCREFLGLLRLHSSADAEQAGIQTCRQRGYRRTDDMIRLANLVAADGDLPQASAILRGVDDLRRLKTDKERGTLIVALLELDQPREAYRRAVRWLRSGRETNFALTIIDQMAIANKHDLGIELAREISVPGDAVSLAVAELMLDRGEPLAARSYLRGWIEKARLNSEDLVSRFILACLDAEDPDNAMLGAQRYGLDKLTQPDLVALAEALAATGRQQQFDMIRAVIKPDVLAENPLLGAAVALHGGAPEASQTLLSAVTVDELDEWRLSLWARLMNRTGRTEDAAVALERLGIEPQVAEPLTTAQPERIALEPRMIRRPKRVNKVRFRRFPTLSSIRAKRPLATAPAVPKTPSSPVAPYDFNRGG
jgi:tetratricopeptide (TPR) repeat protein